MVQRMAVFCRCGSNVSEFRSTEILFCAFGARIAVAPQIQDLLVGAVVSAYEAFTKLGCVRIALSERL